MTNNFFVCIFRVSLVVGRLAGKKNWPLLLLCIRNAILLLASTWPRTVAPEAHSVGGRERELLPREENVFIFAAATGRIDDVSDHI